MSYITKHVVIVFVDGKRKEIAPGRLLPDNIEADALDDLLRLGAIEQALAPEALPVEASAPEAPLRSETPDAGAPPANAPTEPAPETPAKARKAKAD